MKRYNRYRRVRNTTHDGHYSADNIQLVTQAVNIGKSTLSNDAFIAMCIGVANTNHPRPQ